MTVQSSGIYADSRCGGTPLAADVAENATCKAMKCGAITMGTATHYYIRNCTTSERHAYVADVFAGSDYLMVDSFRTSECSSFVGANIFRASGECLSYSASGNHSAIASVNEKGSASIALYNVSACKGEPSQSFQLDREVVASHSCVGKHNAFYSSYRDDARPGSNRSSNSSSDSLDVVESPQTTKRSTETPTATDAPKRGITALEIVSVVSMFVMLVVGIFFLWKRL